MSFRSGQRRLRARPRYPYLSEEKKIPQGSCPRHGSDTRSGSPGDTKQPNRIIIRFIFPLTRKLPFAQVLGFALLAARHVGSVAALQLSSHWEIRSYKVDSKWNIFIDASDIQIGKRGKKKKKKKKKKEGEKKKKKKKREAARGRGGGEGGMRIIQKVRRSALRAVRTSSWLFRKERVMGVRRSPPELQVQVRTWRSCELERQEMDGLRHTKHGQGEAGQWEGDKP